MALFDSKQVKEEKNIYKALLAIKDSSFQLRNSFPQTEKQFLTSTYKDAYICTYKASCEVMKNNELVQALELKNIGACFDLIIEHTFSYNMIKDSINMDFMTYLNIKLNGIKVARESQKELRNQELERERMIGDISGRLKQFNKVSESIKSESVVQEEAKSLQSEMKQREFEEKFPQYMSLKAMIRRITMELQLTEEENRKINIILKIGKEKYSDFSLEHLLLPFLEEKNAMGILTDKEEKKILVDVSLSNMINNYNDHYTKYAEKLFVSISLGAKFFDIDFEKEFDDYLNKFENFKAKYYDVIVNDRKSKLR